MGTTTHYVTINGMTCGCCSGRVNRVLRANPEVLQTMINFDSEQAALLTTQALTTADIVNSIATTGF